MPAGNRGTDSRHEEGCPAELWVVTRGDKGDAMLRRTVTERIGEYLGPVDWSYNFLPHFDGYCGMDKEAYCQEHVVRLRRLSDEPERYLVSTYGGWPRIWHELVHVGMYDGWPYWKPVPSVCTRSWLGPEWHDFSCITNIMDKGTKEIF